MVEIFSDAEFFSVLADQPFLAVGIAAIGHFGITPPSSLRIPFAGML
jgi:hypothetical protein